MACRSDNDNKLINKEVPLSLIMPNLGLFLYFIDLFQEELIDKSLGYFFLNYNSSSKLRGQLIVWLEVFMGTELLLIFIDLSKQMTNGLILS